MKILCVIDHLGPAGAQRQMVTLATGLKKRGHDVDFFVYYPRIDHFRPKLDEARIAVHVSRKRSRWDLGPLRVLRELVRTGDYQISVSFLTTPNIYNVIACLHTPTKSVVSERSAFPFEQVPLAIRLRFGTYRWADHIVVNSRHQHQRLCSEFSWMDSRSSSITNGVDLERYSPKSNTVIEDRVEDHGGDDAETLLAVGSIHSGKNFAGLIEGLQAYRSSFGLPPKIDWAGREPETEDDKKAFANAKEALRRYDLEDRWEWLGVRSDIPELLASHDAFIHPSLFEGLPNAVCEALAAGKPVLASNVCDHPWLVADGERGFLFDPVDADDIAAVIRRFVLLTSGQRREMGKNARAFAEHSLAVDVFVEHYEQLFASML